MLSYLPFPFRLGGEIHTSKVEPFNWALQNRNPQRRRLVFHKCYFHFVWSNWASTPPPPDFTVLWCSKHLKINHLKCLHLGCHSQSFLHRTPGDTGSRWVRWGPLACLGHLRDAPTGWYQQTQICGQGQIEDKTLFSCRQHHVSKS